MEIVMKTLTNRFPWNDCLLLRFLLTHINLHGAPLRPTQLRFFFAARAISKEGKLT